MNQFIFRFTTSASIVAQKVDIEYEGLPMNYLETYLENVQAVTREDIQRVAMKYLHPDAIKMLVVGDREKFDKPLDSFGKVNVIELIIKEMEIKTVIINIPEGANIIIGQTHLIKTTEDLYEIMVNSVPGIRFGIAFCEASGPCLVRAEGNDTALQDVAIQNARNIAAGHTFVILMKEAFPVNVLNAAVKSCPEVFHFLCNCQSGASLSGGNRAGQGSAGRR